MQKTTALGQQFLRFFRWQNRLKKDLIDKVFAFRRDWAGLDGQWPPVASTCRGSNFSKTDCFHVFLFLIMEEMIIKKDDVGEVLRKKLA